MTLAALALAGCSKHAAINAPAVSGGSASFAVVASVGTSVTAGFESAGLVVHHQDHSFTYDFAKQVGAAYTIPSVSADGIPPLLEIEGWTPQGQPIIGNSTRSLGTPTNLLQPAPYNDMGVPGALLNDVTHDTRYTDLTTLFPIIARPSAQLGSILDQVALLNPTFLTFEFGANELLGPASQGVGAPLMDVPTFTALLNATLDSVAVLMPNTKVAILTAPDPASLPYFTTISPYLDPTGTCRVIGPGGPLNLGDLVLLPAGDSLAVGTGVPAPCGGNGRPLPANLVLLAADVATVQAAVAGYNSAIQAAATARGYALADFHGLLQGAAAHGLSVQGHTYTTEFVKGGLFSLDGVHPTDLGYAFICNTLIDAVNAKFGARIPPLNLAAYATATSSRLIPAYGHDGFPIIRNAQAVYGSMFNWRGLRPPVP
jgi:hypothetical protein